MADRAQTSRVVWLAALVFLLGAFATVWWSRFEAVAAPVTIHREPVGIMGTTSRLVAVIPRSKVAAGDSILDAAERELRRAEAVFSTWIDASELSRLNAAPIGEVRLSPDVVALLGISKRLYEDTDGAFDVTAGPLVHLWRQGVETGHVPDEHSLAAARDESTWNDLHLLQNGAAKLRATVELDVDGIAKGYAIDRAVEALIEAGALGGMVEVGGDLRAAGADPRGDPGDLRRWQVAIRSPFSDQVIATVALGERAIATSGGYARPLEIDGRRFSHILDPRNGQPAAGPASVTVVAPSAAVADAWATALSVLGEQGLHLLPEEPPSDALLIFGTDIDPSAIATDGFPDLESVSPGLLLDRAP